MSTNERQSAAPSELRSSIDRVPVLAWSALPDGSLDFFNQRFRDYTGLSPDQLHGTEWKSAVHTDDIQKLETWWQDLRQSQEAGTTEVRLRRFDGEYRWFQIAAAPVHDEQANLVRWFGINIDIDPNKCSERKLRQDEADLRTIVDTIRQPIVVMAPDGATLYANRVVLDRTGLTAGELDDQGFFAPAFHPDDIDRLRAERQEGLLRGDPFDLEARLLFKRQQYRWQLLQYNPLKDANGHVIRWYATAIDIDQQKKTEERLRNENLVLREEIDRSSMFEEIIGSSNPMAKVLKQVEKVAPSDSTVLILGETGTGKELIARALHRRSKRANLRIRKGQLRGDSAISDRFRAFRA